MFVRSLKAAFCTSCSLFVWIAGIPDMELSCSNLHFTNLHISPSFARRDVGKKVGLLAVYWSNGQAEQLKRETRATISLCYLD